MGKRRTDTHRELINSLPKTQVDRLSYIDFRLYFLGELRRSDLGERFKTGPAGATRDIAIYRELAPENLELNGATKVYHPGPRFSPLFEHSAPRVLTALSQGFGQGVDDRLEPFLRSEVPIPLALPDMPVLAPVTRAIHQGKAVHLTYFSVTSGKGTREIVPLALVDIGVRWHIRAFDRKTSEFRDFVITRMTNPTIIDGPIRKEETVEFDLQWTRVIELEFVPHPDHPRPEAVQMDYGMRDGVLRVRTRAAIAGYMLRRWNVDCSPNHRLRGLEHPLWLRDPLTLYGSDSAHLAPGYKDPRHVESTVP